MSVLIQHGLVMDPETGECQVRDLYLADGKVQKKPEVLGEDVQRVDATDLWVVPG